MNTKTTGTIEARELFLWSALLIAGYALINVDTLWGQYLYPQDGYTGIRLLAQLLLYAISGIALGVLLMCLNRYLMLLLLLLLLAAITTNRMTSDLMSLGVMTKENAEWLLSEVRSALDAISQFRGAFVKHVAMALGLLLPFACVVLLCRSRLREQFSRPAQIALIALGVYGTSGMVLYHSFKPRVPIDNNLFFYAMDISLRPTPDIPPADLQPAHASLTQKIVLVVDESLTYEGFAATLHSRWSKWPSVDFGEALSLGNCSAASNAILRWGFRAQPMLRGEDPRRQPTIWSYARSAGYATCLIDGQHNGAYQNYMTKKEAALIDQYLGVSQGLDTDHAIAERLHGLLSKPGKTFIYVNKRGDHFPYANNYPPDEFKGARTEKQRYSASIQYSSDDFLDTMLQGLSLSDLLIIFTSDHGDRFDGVGIPHCNVLPSPEEIRVPMLLLTGNEMLASQAAASSSVLKHRAGHEQIFATLLDAMGYDLHAAEALYGTSLLSSSVPQHYYHVLHHPIASEGGAPAVIEITRTPYVEPRP